MKLVLFSSIHISIEIFHSVAAEHSIERLFFSVNCIIFQIVLKTKKAIIFFHLLNSTHDSAQSQIYISYRGFNQQFYTFNGEIEGNVVETDRSIRLLLVTKIQKHLSPESQKCYSYSFNSKIRLAFKPKKCLDSFDLCFTEKFRF